MRYPLMDARVIFTTASLHNPPIIPQSMYPENPECGDALVERAWALNLVKEKGQMIGTTLEQLCEIAGRICYDSLGTGRTSEAYHQHLVEVNHGSVHEHAVFTIEVTSNMYAAVTAAALLAHRPGVLVTAVEGNTCRASINLRAVREWNNKDFLFPSDAYRAMEFELGARISQAVGQFVPQVMNQWKQGDVDYAMSVRTVEAHLDEEKWISMYMSGSRGFSHEQVRHKYRTAVSQRSTRYVDETDSPWVKHPLIEAWQEAHPGQTLFKFHVPDDHPANNVQEYIGKEVYAPTVNNLQKWLISKGIDKTTARKQARGAARGYLGNALHTEMVFSASVAQWKRMLKQRASAAADAEIRVIFTTALAALKTCAYSADFASFNLIPSPDGLGQCLE